MAKGVKPAAPTGAASRPTSPRPSSRATVTPAAKPGRFAAFRQRLATQAPQQTASVNFFREAYSELRKVHWPTRQETTHMTIMVIVFSLATGLVLGGMDFVYAKLIAFLVGA